MNTRNVERAKRLLAADPRREVYQGANDGFFYITYSNGQLPEPLTKEDVKELIRQGVIHEDFKCWSMYRRGRSP